MNVRELGVELTFIPDFPGKWKEFRDQTQAIETVAKFNSALRAHPDVLTYRRHLHGESSGGLWPFWGKVDVFRSRSFGVYQGSESTRQPHKAWCLEVNSEPIDISNLIIGGKTTYLWKALEAVYAVAAGLNLHPSIQRVNKRTGARTEWPTGGGHLHVPVDIWNDDSAFLLRLYMLERSLCVDYTNRPYIRWLFSQWSDNVNSAIAMGPVVIKAAYREARREKKPKAFLTNVAHSAALDCHSIKQRMALTGKPILPTYEFRFFDMPHSVNELGLQARFLAAWINHHVDVIEAGEPIWKHPAFTLTTREFNRLACDAKYARAKVEAFFGQLGLEFAPYEEPFWERQYLTRLKWGKPL